MSAATWPDVRIHQSVGNHRQNGVIKLEYFSLLTDIVTILKHLCK